MAALANKRLGQLGQKWSDTAVKGKHSEFQLFVCSETPGLDPQRRHVVRSADSPSITSFLQVEIAIRMGWMALKLILPIPSEVLRGVLARTRASELISND